MFLMNHHAIALNGHTHCWREFHTLPLKNPPPKVKPQLGYEAPSPCAIYWDDYTSIYQSNPESLEDLLPLHLQTPSLGFQNVDEKLLPGAFRKVEVRTHAY